MAVPSGPVLRCQGIRQRRGHFGVDLAEDVSKPGLTRAPAIGWPSGPSTFTVRGRGFSRTRRYGGLDDACAVIARPGR